MLETNGIQCYMFINLTMSILNFKTQRGFLVGETTGGGFETLKGIKHTVLFQETNSLQTQKA